MRVIAAPFSVWNSAQRRPILVSVGERLRGFCAQNTLVGVEEAGIAPLKSVRSVVQLHSGPCKQEVSQQLGFLQHRLDTENCAKVVPTDGRSCAPVKPFGPHDF